VIERVWAIALNTFREAVRIRVLYGILVLVVGANLMTIILGEMASGEEARVARDVGIAAISLVGSLTAIFLGVFLLYTEVQRRTIHTIVSKPIARWEFVIGKYAGMCVVLTVLVAAFAAALLVMLSARGFAVTPAIGKAILLTWLEVMTVAAVAIFFSSFSTPFLSGIFALGIWILGRITPDIERATNAPDVSGVIHGVAKVTRFVVPDLDLFSASYQVEAGVTVHGDFVSWDFIGLAALHGGLWIVGLLAAAALLFHRRDFA
jgi:hypothetical protein